MKETEPVVRKNQTTPDSERVGVDDRRLFMPLPDLWEEIETGKTWARATKQINGNLMRLKCELKLLGTQYRWMTLNPQKFGVADTLQDAIEQVESFLHNVQVESPTSEGAGGKQKEGTK